MADDQLEPAEAVRAYHGDLQKLGIPPQRSLADDLQSSETSGSYAGQSTGRSKTLPGKPGPRSGGAEPDFSKMTQAEKIQWNLERWKRILD